MAVFFSKAAGQVQSIPDPSLPASVSFRLENWGGFVGFRSVITRVTVSAKGNFQFLHSLGGQVFIYVFGDRIGQLSVTGVAFDSACGSPSGLLGIENVLNYYSANRVSARRTPIKLVIGASTALEAHLLDVTGDLVDPRTRVWQFSLHMALIPRDEPDPVDEIDEDEGGGGGGGEAPTPDEGEELLPIVGDEPDQGGYGPNPYSVQPYLAAGWGDLTAGPNTGLILPWTVEQ